MMKRRFTSITAFATLFVLLSCSKDCEPDLAKCNEVPESGICAAYQEGWFFDKGANTCQKIGFSGCYDRGFETEQECNECKCND